MSDVVKQGAPAEAGGGASSGVASGGPAVSRRGFLAAGVGVAALVGIGGVGAVSGSAEAAYVRPPGAASNAALVAACNRCDRCVQACPYGIVAPVPLTAGFVPYGTPQLVFKNDYCDFCMKCTNACPTGALSRGGERERDCGVAVVVKDACVAWDWAGCTLCKDECPVEGAITLDNQQRPVVHADVCDGCGKCEQVCPSASVRSYNADVYERGIVVVSRESAAAQYDGALTSAELTDERYTGIGAAAALAPHTKGMHPDGPDNMREAGGSHENE